MSDWIIWVILAGIVLMLEIFTGTFYLLMVSIGLFGGGIAALMGAQRPFQLILAAAIGGIATLLLQHKRKMKGKSESASDPNVNLDIGQILNVPAWNENGDGRYTARAMYRGSMWDVEFIGKGTPHSGNFTIREVKGSRLFVSRHPEH